MKTCVFWLFVFCVFSDGTLRIGMVWVRIFFSLGVVLFLPYIDLIHRIDIAVEIEGREERKSGRGRVRKSKAFYSLCSPSLGYFPWVSINRRKKNSKPSSFINMVP